MTEIIVKPFDWNDNFSEVAQEDFSMIQKSLSYGTASSIGMALAKLELLEKQGCKVEPLSEESEDTEIKLNEAIERYTNNAEFERTHGNLQGCLEFRQLAEWLRELKQLKEQEPTGHWEWVQYDYNPKLGNWHCSKCRSIVIECVNKKDKGGIPFYKYCPQCGVKMFVAESEEA